MLYISNTVVYITDAVTSLVSTDCVTRRIVLWWQLREWGAKDIVTPIRLVNKQQLTTDWFSLSV